MKDFSPFFLPNFASAGQLFPFACPSPTLSCIFIKWNNEEVLLARSGHQETFFFVLRVFHGENAFTS